MEGRIYRRKVDRRHVRTTLLAAAAMIVAAAHSADAIAQAARPSPRLVVCITIDNLTTSQLERHERLYGDNGFKRLLKGGTVYCNVSYTFAPLDRVSAVAAVVTGATPYYNGITGARWLDRTTLRPAESMGNGAASILSSTITDELKVATGGRGLVYAVAEDESTAIITGGHAADAALWLNGKGRWVNAAQPTAADMKWLGAFNRVDAETTSPHAYARITAMALQCVSSGGMGTDDVGDILSVTYTAEDGEDAYVSLDKCIGELLSGTERTVGEGNVLFIVTGTGCEPEATGDYALYGIPTGIFYINRAQNLLNMYLSATYGQGRYVEASFRNQIFLNKKLIEQRNMSAEEVENRSRDFIMELSGVRNVYTSRGILANECPDERVRNGFNPAVCGDLVIEIAPGWSLLNEDTQEHFQQRSSAVPFPVIVFGCGVPCQTVAADIATDRIAPTIAKCLRIRAPNACRASALF